MPDLPHVPHHARVPAPASRPARPHPTIIETARTAGHERIAEKNTKILNNLDKIIDVCESCDDGEVVLGGKVAQLDDAS